jgi:uncharacterized protein YndB with AHSA1/START domain
MRMDDVTDGGNIDANISRSFDASVERVFDQWVDADALRTWFAPNGFTVTFCETSAVVGGRWQVEMRSEDGEVYLEYGEYCAIARPRRLVFTLTQGHSSDIGPRTTVTVDFNDKDGGTEIAFLQEGFETVERRDGNVEGWNECFDKLEASLAST